MTRRNQGPGGMNTGWNRRMGAPRPPLDPHPNNPQPLPPGQTPPINPPAGTIPPPAGVPGAPGAPGGAPGAPLPHLNQNIRSLLDTMYDPKAQHSYGTAAMPGSENDMRRFLRGASAAGLGNNQLRNLMNPALLRGANDPYGRNGLIGDITDRKSLMALSRYGAGLTGSGLEQGSSTGAQSALFDAVPGLREKYMAMANTYGRPYSEDATNPNDTPMTAVLGEDGRYHDPAKPLPAQAGSFPIGGAPAAPPPVIGNGDMPPPGPPPASPLTAPGTQNTGWNGTMGAQPPGTQTNLSPAGQPQVQGGPSTAGSTALGQNANNRPANPGAQVAYGAKGNKMGVPKDQQRRNLPGGAGGPAGPGVPSGAPGAPTGAPQNFLPSTPEFEHGQGGLEDQLAAQLAQIGVAREQIPAYLAMMSGRAGTDQTYATQTFNGDMTGRGIYDSGITPMLNQRDIGIPYGRQAQDLALGAAGQYADLATQEGNAYLGYDQGMSDLLLQRALQVAQQMPLSVSQYRQKPQKPGKPRRRNNR